MGPLGDVLHQAAHAHRDEVTPADRQPGEQTQEDPVKPARPERARAAGHADDRGGPVAAEHEQITRIDGHAEVLDHAADALERRRDHVAAIHDRRGAEGEDRRAAVRQQLSERLGHRDLVVIAADLGGERAAGGGEAGADPLRGSIEQDGGSFGETRQHQAGAVRLKRRDPQDRRPGGQIAPRVDDGAADRERDDLHRGHHVAGGDGHERGERGEGDRLVERVQPVDPLAIHDAHAGGLGVEVAAPGRRGGRVDMLAGDGVRDPRGGRVLAEVAVIEQRGDDARVTSGGERGQIIRAELAPFLEHAAGETEGVPEDRPLGDGQFDAIELHARASRGDGSRPLAHMQAPAAGALRLSFMRGSS